LDRSDPLFESLPAPASLSRSAAAALERKLRREIRPALCDDVAGLYAAGASTDEQTVDLFGFELRLQEIDRCLLDLAVAQQRPGWEALPSGELAFEPSNADCVHGPLLLLDAGRAARRFLRDGESFRRLESVRWQRPVRRRLEIEVTEDQLSFTPADATCGVFLTSAGRRLSFRGTEKDDDEWVTMGLAPNAVAFRLAHGELRSEGAADYSMIVDPGRLSAAQEALLDDDVLAVATFVDLACTLILNLRRGVPALCCGAEAFPVEGLGKAVGEGQPFALHLRVESTRLAKSSALRIVRYGVRLDPAQEWSSVIMAEADDPLDILRLLHTRASRS